MAADPALVQRVRRRLAATGSPPTAGLVASAVRAEGGGFGADTELFGVLAAVQSELRGAGPLEHLLRDESVTDVLVNGASQVWVDRGAGLEATGIRFSDDRAVRQLAQRLAGLAGRRLDDAVPWVDAALPDGVRLHAVLPPVSSGGPCLSLRVPRRTAFTWAELVARRTVPAEGADLLQRLAASRTAFLVTGGTGSGKTTLLSCLLSAADPGERLVVLEDTPELAPAHGHLVRLQTRQANLEGAGAVTLRDLVRQALRMRPDRLVVGEVRGAEAVDLLAALNTGHDGGCATLHANAPGDVPARLSALTAPAGLGEGALRAQLLSGLRVLVHVTRDRHCGERRVSEVAVLLRCPRDGVRVARAWGWAGGVEPPVVGPAAPELAAWLG